MTHHARCLVDTCLAIHALAPWDVFGEAQFFAVSIPGCSSPFVTRFLMGIEGPIIEVSEARPRVEFGLEMGIIFSARRVIPRKWRGLMREAGRRKPRRARTAARSTAAGSTAADPAILLAVAPPDGTALPSIRSAEPREIRIALYATTALQKAWTNGLIHPQFRPKESNDEPAGAPIGKAIIPLLKLSGPPDNPAIEMSELRIHRHDPAEVELAP